MSATTELLLRLPLSADLYIRAKDLPAINADRRPNFRTKLQFAADQIRWTAQRLPGTDQPIWFVVDGAYGKRSVLKEAKARGVIVVSCLRRDAALWELPPKVPASQTGPARPHQYGTRRLHLAKRAAHSQGWQQVVCWQSQKQVIKTVKTFLATYKLAGGMIRVVMVKQDDGWRAYFCTDPQASVQDILEAAAGRTTIEQTYQAVKEVEGAGQQQSHYWLAKVGHFLGVRGATRSWNGGLGTSPRSSCATGVRHHGMMPTGGRRMRIAVKLCSVRCWRARFNSMGGNRPYTPEIRDILDVLLDLVA